jgi:mRNA-degrading endonuclease YafQ of YafQ-DinJ toxin-antitoxin module
VSRYRYKATPKFWRSYRKLSPSQHESVFAAWKIFREDPFHPRLRTHKIQRLSAAAGRTVYAVDIEADLRAVFIMDGDMILSLDIGTHAIYKP